MKSDLNKIDVVIRRLLPSAPAEEMESDAARVLQRLRSMSNQVADREEVDPFRDLEARSGLRWGSIAKVAAIAAALLVAVATTVEWRHRDEMARVDSVDGSLYRIVEGKTLAIPAGEAIERDQSVRTNGGAGAMFALADGSRVEMRAQSELALQRAGDGVRIRLWTGSIIVNAAKQPKGHLYVQTNDVTVSVVGTVFLVNAEREGSRVAVIEGEVRVRQKSTETKLRPGEQVSTSPTLAVRSVKEEIAWSIHADAHRAILEAFTRGMAATAGPLQPLANVAGAGQAAINQTSSTPAQPQFEEASIRPCDPDNVPPAPEGARGGGANSFQMTPGRTHALCLTLATIIRHAYGYGPAGLDFINPGGRGRGLGMNNVYGLGVEDGRRVKGGPDWVRSEHYTIDAVADGAADAETMSGAMMRDVLSRRFQLKVHIDMEQVPAFDLAVAKSGLKIKPVDTSACTPPPRMTPGVPMIFRPVSFADVRRGEKPTCGLSGQRNGPNMVLVGGATQLAGLGRSLGGNLGQVQVFDKTGNTDRFNFILEFAIDENVRPPVLPPSDTDSANVPRGETILTAVEDQLGLKLEPARGSRDVIVIDRVERPSPN